jgi:hypothetical protein
MLPNHGPWQNTGVTQGPPWSLAGAMALLLAVVQPQAPAGSAAAQTSGGPQGPTVSAPVAAPSRAAAAGAPDAPAAADGAGGAGCTAPPDAGALEAAGAVIGHVAIAVGDIFNPELEAENNDLFRLINRLHRNTRPGVIGNRLLFRSGDRFSRRLIEESERLLRSERYLYDASIRPVAWCDGRVDLAVEVRDVWTLEPSASYSRSGGVGGTRFEVEDTNFLGTGKHLAVARREDVDRTMLLAHYRDPGLAGSRVRVDLWYSDNSDGGFQVFDVRRPFFALDTRWAAGVRVRLDDRVDNRYLLGGLQDRFRHRQDFAEAFFGLSRGLREGRALRWLAGATYLDDEFGKAPEGEPLIDEPENRTLAYPWLGFELVGDDYRVTHNLDQLQRTEDLHLGLKLTGRVGWSSTRWGGDAEEAVFALAAERGFELGERGLALLAGSSSGRHGDDGLANFLTGASLRLYWRNFGQHLFYAALSGDVARDLDPDNQLLLGGDNGLRGYPLRYQEGDRRFLLTVEQRFYTPWHVLELVHVGAAVFADLGRAWGESVFPTLPPTVPARETGRLRDVGFGLRLSSSRSGRGTLVHLDVAFPLDGDASIEQMQWLVTTRESF